jgi:hypothetical protein
MAELKVYRIAEGDALLYRMAEDGTTIRLAEGGSDTPPVPPDWLKDVIMIRRSIGDPIVNDFILTVELPDSGVKGTAYVLYDTAYNGQYNYWDGTQWKQFDLKFSDAYIQMLLEKDTRLNTSIILINNLIARIDPTDYITSGNAGGQSVSFPSLADMLAFYEALKKALLDEAAAEAGLNSSVFLKSKPVGVGGVMRGENLWV